MLVKFSCGCIGLINVQGDEANRPVLIYPCDLNGDECWEPLGLHRRDMGDKGHEPLSSEESAELIGDLNRLVGDGYRFRKVQSLLAPR